MTDSAIPSPALAMHTAILGMTGAGKTNTSKVAIEQVYVEGARVCILDPIKSDWWGITSSADGRHPGLPFHILGGPRGHVPLHSGAGAAIGELVARGTLRHSIIDMAQFEPGGQVRFFVDFVPALLREMRGFVYLVLEEAHMFAPKERGGVGNENMAVHWAKMIATAGRSKGIRLIVATQRTQSLHNAVLGSCQTLIAHQLLSPADQEPVLKWLKAHIAEKATRDQVEGSLGSLATGEGWIVSGSARIADRRQFPKAATYDNTATPTDDDTEHDVATAPVDRNALRSIIGQAVKEAEENDVDVLRARIKELERGAPAATADTAPRAELAAEYTRGREDGFDAALAGLTPFIDRATTLQAALDEHIGGFIDDLRRRARTASPATNFPEKSESSGPLLQQDNPGPPARAITYGGGRQAGKTAAAGAGGGTITDKAQRAFLTVLAQQKRALTRNQIAILAGYSSKSSHVDNTISACRTRGFIVGGRDRIEITADGRKALGRYSPLPTGAELQAYWIRELDGAGAKFLTIICAAHPRTLTRDQVAEKAGYSTASSHVDNTLSALRTRGLITGGRDGLRASEELFG